eukprot:TRINITY_DN7586_c0_g1_i1.p1 TRINITY_DN7586_c0_g1~~TRINITY_DN7586_c0_g1_i1.p1  ORF type:complete len:481 (-),score=91.91 TRINITY_DN7586_c0_g1_i1:55-1497(-)
MEDLPDGTLWEEHTSDSEDYVEDFLVASQMARIYFLDGLKDMKRGRPEDAMFLFKKSFKIYQKHPGLREYVLNREGFGSATSRSNSNLEPNDDRRDGKENGEEEFEDSFDEDVEHDLDQSADHEDQQSTSEEPRVVGRAFYCLIYRILMFAFGARGGDQAEEGPDRTEAVRVLEATSYYDVLQVERSASTSEIKKSYRQLALRLHPDKNKSADAEVAFKVLGDAYKTLSEETSRHGYDQIITTQPEFLWTPWKGGRADDDEISEEPKGVIARSAVRAWRFLGRYPYVPGFIFALAMLFIGKGAYTAWTCLAASRMLSRRLGFLAGQSGRSVADAPEKLRPGALLRQFIASVLLPPICGVLLAFHLLFNFNRSNIVDIWNLWGELSFVSFYQQRASVSQNGHAPDFSYGVKRNVWAMDGRIYMKGEDGNVHDITDLFDALRKAKQGGRPGWDDEGFHFGGSSRPKENRARGAPRKKGKRRH